MGVFKIFRNVQNILPKDELINSTLKLTFQGQYVTKKKKKEKKRYHFNVTVMSLSVQDYFLILPWASKISHT